MATWMGDWTGKTDEQVFGAASEQPGSQSSYWREIEIKRRLYILQKDALQAQLDVIAQQKDATEAQREAIAEMRSQSRILLWSVIGIFATALMTLIAAFI